MTARHVLVGLLAVALLGVPAAAQPGDSGPRRWLPVPAHAVAPDVTGLLHDAEAEEATTAAVAGRTSGRDEDRGPRLRRAVLASAGLAVAGALVAYWNHNEAEAAYDRYLRSAGQARQEAALDDAERHDRIAGAGFLLMEVGLVLSARVLFF